MKVGDLVKEKRFQERTGIIVAEVRRDADFHNRLFEVLWNTPSPALPTPVGPAWCNQLELISESR